MKPMSGFPTQILLILFHSFVLLIWKEDLWYLILDSYHELYKIKYHKLSLLSL